MPVRRVFKTRAFARLQRKSGLTDTALCKAVLEMESGLIEANLGSGVVKKRVPLPGRGKSGGARTIVATTWSGHWFFLYLFAKNERPTISDRELEGLQEVAVDLLKMTPEELDQAVARNALLEICDGDKN